MDMLFYLCQRDFVGLGRQYRGVINHVEVLNPRFLQGEIVGKGFVWIGWNALVRLPCSRGGKIRRWYPRSEFFTGFCQT